MATTARIIKRDGKATVEPSLDFLLSTLRNGEYTLDIKRKVEQRTISQNALMWLWFQCIEDETGTTKQDVHDYYCNKYLQRQTSVGGRPFIVTGSTSALSTAEMTRFLNLVQADAATEMGIMLPLPEDLYYREFYNHYKH